MSGIHFVIRDPRGLQESPDILIESKGRSVGLEVVELSLDGSPVGGSRLRRSESQRAAIVRRAKAVYENAGHPSVNVRVLFEPRSAIDPAAQEDLARDLASVIADVDLPTSEQVHVGPKGSPRLRLPFSEAYVRAMPGHVTPRWQVAEAGWSAELRSSHFEAVLEKKNRLLIKYRAAVPEVWLLMVADGFKPSGMFRASSGDISLPESRFDRTFFLCEPGRVLLEWPGLRENRATLRN